MQVEKDVENCFQYRFLQKHDFHLKQECLRAEWPGIIVKIYTLYWYYYRPYQISMEMN